MFCPNCGAELESNDKFCRYCGYAIGLSESAPMKVSGYVREDPVFTPHRETAPEVPTMGMKWYPFVVKLQLWLTMLGLLSTAGQIGTGAHYGELRDQVYQMFPKLETVDIAYAVLCFVMIFFAFITRRELRDYEWSGVKKYMVLCAFTFFSPLLYAIATSVATGLENMIDLSVLIASITGLVYLVLNNIYFLESGKFVLASRT